MRAPLGTREGPRSHSAVPCDAAQYLWEAALLGGLLSGPQLLKFKSAFRTRPQGTAGGIAHRVLTGRKPSTSLYRADDFLNL